MRIRKEDTSIRVTTKHADWWFYAGGSFNLDNRIQRQRISRDCGYAQIAYGSGMAYGLPARRTLGVTYSGRRW